MFCPVCQGEFREGITVCNTCEVPLVAALPAREEPTDIQWRRVATFADPTRANLAAEYLRAEDVDVLLDNEQTIGLSWWYGQALGGVPLLVPAEQEAKAREMLESLGSPTLEEPPEFEGGHVDDLSLENTRRRNRAKVLVSLLLGGAGALLYRLMTGPDNPPSESGEGDV
jgi:hypothetical protein